MCGIAGFLSSSALSDDAGARAGAMAARLSHRGPDSHGEWVDQEAGVGLGHARLSIQDLSTAGHQPMISHCGRYVISYNGEVYNFRELREQLAGPF